jgi:hypothetical protein
MQWLKNERENYRQNEHAQKRPENEKGQNGYRPENQQEKVIFHRFIVHYLIITLKNKKAIIFVAPNFSC